jgi:hypothetical protein
LLQSALGYGLGKALQPSQKYTSVAAAPSSPTGQTATQPAGSLTAPATGAPMGSGLGSAPSSYTPGGSVFGSSDSDKPPSTVWNKESLRNIGEA